MRNIHYQETRYGFEYGAVSVERMWSHNGHVCIRLVCRTKRGKSRYVDVQASPKGRRLHVFQGDEKSG